MEPVFSKASMAGIIGCIFGVIISVVWLQGMLWIFGNCHIDPGDAVNYRLATPNLAASWLAYGLLPFFAAAGFVVTHSLCGGKGDRLRGRTYICYVLIGYALWLVISLMMQLGHVSMGIGYHLYTGYMFVALVSGLMIAYPLMIKRLLAGRSTVAEAEKSSDPVVLTIAIIIILYVMWIIGVSQILFVLLSNRYGPEAASDLLINNPALDWVQTGTLFFLCMASFYIAYRIYGRGNPELDYILKAFRKATLFSLTGVILWLIMASVLLFQKVHIAPMIVTGAGYVFLIILLLYQGQVIYPGYLAGRKDADRSGNSSPAG